jgi:hypothetical protein
MMFPIARLCIPGERCPRFSPETRTGVMGPWAPYLRNILQATTSTASVPPSRGEGPLYTLLTEQRFHPGGDVHDL